VDYAFINKSAIDVYVDQNKVSDCWIRGSGLKVPADGEEQVNLFRVAFLLERMCPLSYGLGAKFNETVRTFSHP
jgi:endoglucanase